MSKARAALGVLSTLDKKEQKIVLLWKIGMEELSVPIHASVASEQEIMHVFKRFSQRFGKAAKQINFNKISTIIVEVKSMEHSVLVVHMPAARAILKEIQHKDRLVAITEEMFDSIKNGHIEIEDKKYSVNPLTMAAIGTVFKK